MAPKVRVTGPAELVRMVFMLVAGWSVIINVFIQKETEFVRSSVNIELPNVWCLDYG